MSLSIWANVYPAIEKQYVSSFKHSQQEEQMLRWLTFKCTTGENMLLKSLKHTSVTKKHILRIYSDRVLCITMHCLDYSGQESFK